jgi:hypothetical protein
MGILNCWWPAHRSFFSHRSFSEDGSEGAACPREAQRPPGYTLQVRATRHPTLGGLSVSIPCRCQNVVFYFLGWQFNVIVLNK